MRRLLVSSACAVILGLAAATSASAQQSVNIYVGGFIPNGEQLNSGNISGRNPDDVLAANASFLAFNFRDFRGATVGGEWLVALGDRFDAGLGVGFYQRTAPSVYFDLVNQLPGGSTQEIAQDLKLRVVPFSATIRFLPLGHHDAFEPYVGAGVGVYAYRYQESGDFVGSDGNVFPGTFTGTGSAVGPVILGGARFPIGNVGVGGEIRYQAASGKLPASEDFAGSKIDLGGFNYLFTVNFRF